MTALVLAVTTSQLKAEDATLSKLMTEANASAKQGDLKQALDSINQAIALDTANPRLYKFRGNVYFAMENYPAALSDFNKVIELLPNASSAYSDRSIVYYAMKNYQSALKDTDTALNLDPTNPVALSVRLKVLKELRAR